MKNKLTSTLILAAFGAVGASQLLAQTVPDVQMVVPFEFVAGNQEFPAGTYVIQTNLAQQIVSVKGIDHPVSTLVLARREPGGSARETKLTFHRYGDRNFLFRVAAQGSPAVTTVQGSKLEKQAKKAEGKPTDVSLMAQR